MKFKVGDKVNTPWGEGIVDRVDPDCDRDPPLQYYVKHSRGTYQEDGSFNEGGSCSDWDLIEEYVKPKMVEVWAVVNNKGDIVKASSDKTYLKHNWPEFRVIKMREVTDE